jgi:hypothetical protein
MAQLPITRFKGLTPLLDPKRIEEPVIVDGANFYVAPDGPTTGFARREILHHAFTEPKGVQSLKLTTLDSVFYFVDGAILEYDSVNRSLCPRLILAQPSVIWPWTSATVGGDVYFARKGYDLIKYTTQTGVWSAVTGPSVPTNIVAIAQSGGRLVALAAGVLAWTAIDDGTDFTTSTVTGAGAQSLSLINSTDPDQPLILLPYEHGVMTYTTEGIMRSELVNAINPFRHRAISNRHVPINPFCAINIAENTQVILARSGFFTTVENNRAEDPVAWQPAMGEHLHLNILPLLDLNANASVRLSHDFDRGWFFVSLADGSDTSVYNKSFMLYMPSNEWGSFNRVHTAFLDVKIESGPNAGFHAGFCDNAGSLFQFIPELSVVDELFPDGDKWIYDYHPPAEFTPRTEDGVYRMPTHMHMAPFSEHIFTRGAGVYNLDDDLAQPEYFSVMPTRLPELSIWDDGQSVWDGGASTWDVMHSSLTMQTALRHILVLTRLANAKPAPLDGFIRIGVFRGGTKLDIDELINVLTVSISANEPPEPVIFEDYINDYAGSEVIEDWNILDEPAEDYGLNTVIFSDYTVELLGTIDGFNVWENQRKVPSLIQSEGRTRYYDGNITGLYHLIDIKAEAVEHVFQIKVVELEIIPVGRLK